VKSKRERSFTGKRTRTLQKSRKVIRTANISSRIYVNICTEITKITVPAIRRVSVTVIMVAISHSLFRTIEIVDVYVIYIDKFPLAVILFTIILFININI